MSDPFIQHHLDTPIGLDSDPQESAEWRDAFHAVLQAAGPAALEFVKPADASPEMCYLHARRTALGGLQRTGPRGSRGGALQSPASRRTAAPEPRGSLFGG